MQQSVENLNKSRKTPPCQQTTDGRTARRKTRKHNALCLLHTEP